MTFITAHPGEILRDRYLVPHGMSATALALDLHVPANRITEIVNGRRSVSPETALRLGRYFATTPGFWLSLQSSHDLSLAQAESGSKVEQQVRPRELTQHADANFPPSV